MLLSVGFAVRVIAGVVVVGSYVVGYVNVCAIVGVVVVASDVAVTVVYTSVIVAGLMLFTMHTVALVLLIWSVFMYLRLVLLFVVSVQ